MVVFKPLLYLLHDEFAAYDEPYVANDGGQEVSVPGPVAPGRAVVVPEDADHLGQEAGDDHGQAKLDT